MIRIYGKPRSRTFRCLWMAEETGVPYENVKTEFDRGEARTPEFLRINPNGHVPALEDGDVRLFESLAINLYLARRYGGALWPRDVADEGRVFQWSIWAMTAASRTWWPLPGGWLPTPRAAWSRRSQPTCRPCSPIPSACDRSSGI